MKKLLWLDDYRDPFDKKVDWLVFSPIGRDVDLYWVKDYDEFTKWILTNGLPDGICFDHDLSDIQVFKKAFPDLMEDVEVNEKTGYDCALFITNYCIDNKLNLPKYNIQSANPVGKLNIDTLLKNYINHFE